ncbi:MAG: hypothetical protein JXP34_18915 [Planctomycetes bacterium]|nr:hypothetical protein [Planctomycetota bacterium]
MSDPSDSAGPREDLCRRCGLCCREKVDIDGVVFYTKLVCDKWDPETGLCRIYERRREYRQDCADLRRAIEGRFLPAGCPYVRDLDGYDPPVVDWEDPEVQAILDRLPADPRVVPLPPDLARLDARGFVERAARRRSRGSLEVIALVHPKERASKCSLRALRGRPDLRILPLRRAREIDGGGGIVLAVGSPPLSPADRGRPLVVLDGTWRRVDGMLGELPRLDRRSLPGFASAYPRRTKLFRDPDGGLASAEAIFAATVLLGAPDPSWLDGYPWREAFLRANAEILAAARIRKGANDGGAGGVGRA